MVAGGPDADILLLSSAIGSGHMRASAAVVRGVELQDPERECRVVDFPHEVSPGVEHLLRGAYLESLKLWPAAYGRLYRSSGGAEPGSYRHYVQRAGLKTLERLARATGARALVAPHFYGAGVLGYYKERDPRVLAAVVLTDYVPHPIGVPPNLDLYVVADEAAAEVVAGLRVPDGRIHPTGIPIDPAFEQPADASGVRRELLHLEDDDLPLVLVMGGGLGGASSRPPYSSSSRPAPRCTSSCCAGPTTTLASASSAWPRGRDTGRPSSPSRIASGISWRRPRCWSRNREA